MSFNISALKKSSSSDLLAKLKKGIEDSTSKQSKEKDSRFWSPTIDAAGNSSATIRFLPAKTEDDFPFVKVHRHVFQENGMWFINECPTTIGKECPVCADNKRRWSTNVESEKEIARKHGRKTNYIANILVIKDPANPENDGQVKLYKFNKKIYDKLIESMSADPELGETPVNPFSFFDGGNFIVRTQTVGEYLNFDKCKVVPTADLFDGDEEKLMALMEKLYDLNEFKDEKLFKEYADMEARFNKVVNGAASTPKQSDDEIPESKTPAEKFEKQEKMDAPAKSNNSGDEDDDLAFFNSLLNN